MGFSAIKLMCALQRQYQENLYFHMHWETKGAGGLLLDEFTVSQ